MSLGCSVHTFIKQRLNDGSIPLRWLYSCSGCAGVFRQLLWLLISSPSAYFSSIQGACFNRSLLTTALLRHYSVCPGTCGSLEQNPFLTETSGKFAIKEKSSRLISSSCMFAHGIFRPIYTTETRENLFMWNPVISLEIVL